MPFCDPDVFIAGQLHHFAEVWKQIAAFSSYDRTDEVLDMIKHKVYLTNFFKPFKGNLKGVSYDSDMPPSTEFGNNKSCDGFRDFIDKTILERVCSSAISVWGWVGAVKPPHLVVTSCAKTYTYRFPLNGQNAWLSNGLEKAYQAI